ncbi:outer membrane beta-barrel protein [uncultured Tenacibaculum sp.]|uniref:outer membrane beta-barrel protein n=1 Tax=uncultured Tenacibaculum sp. TaxID=174713 RepID=UPI00261121C9|nr:outer membrane beta-barrel protein [uncultured Tenacibaculum sp.]
MMEDKNIDRLFQENLKDFEVIPDPKIWQNIEDKLSKKKKKRVLPFWWLSSGVAAILLITLLITNPFKESTDPNLIIPITEENSNRNTVETKTIQIDIDTTNTNLKTNTNKVEEAVASEFVKKEPIKNKSVIQEERITIAKAVKKRNKSIINSKIVNTNKNSKNDKKELKKGIIKENDKTLIAKNNIPESKNKKINKKKKEDINAIAALVEEDKEKENNAEKAKKKWSVTPVVGLLASSAFSGGSPIDERLNQNSISTDGTLAYGMKVSYQLNDKWSLRTGVQFQKNVINTENVGLVSTIASSNNLSAVNFSINDRFTFLSLEPGDANSVNSPTSLSPGIRVEEGSLAQTYSYFEVPVEVQYLFYESKSVKTQLVTGFSTLFLNENSIALNSSVFNQDIGEANNLNSLNFSGNLGINIDVQLSKHLNLNLNPMLKAQLNTFSGNSNGFTPFIFGIYSGVTFDF